VLTPDCISCNTITGEIDPPGGIIYENEYWIMFLRSKPLLVPGEGFIVLKRHAEILNELTAAELTSLGPTMQLTFETVSNVLKPAKVHFGLYAEAVKHIHFHVFPRTSYLPAGNIPITILGVWYDLLHTVGLRRAYQDDEVSEVAARMRQEFQRLIHQREQT
jgi:diadenosine tetraphosphate (Ap4A) HIT family hydrolase